MTKEWFSIDDLKNSHELRHRFELGVTDMQVLEEKFEFITQMIKKNGLPPDSYIKLEFQSWDETHSDFIRQFRPPFNVNVVILTSDIKIVKDRLLLAPTAIKSLVTEGKMSKKVITASRN